MSCAAAAAAGGLSDQGRAVIMGERTFGKGVVQYFFPMGDGSGLKLTVAKYLTPKMYDISKNGGLTPDIMCKDYPHGEREEGGRHVGRCWWQW
jgi:C-terminal processing protease CtpA/Prc